MDPVKGTSRSETDLQKTWPDNRVLFLACCLLNPDCSLSYGFSLDINFFPLDVVLPTFCLTRGTAEVSQLRGVLVISVVVL